MSSPRPAGNATPDDVTHRTRADPAKARVMAYFRRLVADGYAEWHMRENREVELRLHTGEAYLLAKTMIIRIA